MRKIHDPFLRVLILIVSLLGLGGCIHSEHYRASGKVHNCAGLYSNVYDVYWWGIYKESNAFAIYITDSTNFRLYLGISNESEGYNCDLKNDTLYIDKSSLEQYDYPTVVERRKYSLKALKRAHKFE